MFHPDQSHQIIYLDPAPVAVAAEPRRGCLIPGCPCKDARIVSHRRAAFFAAMARRTGQTADRVIAPVAAYASFFEVSA
jgi:hypothetical protein